MENERELPTSVSSSTVGDDASFTSTLGDDDKDLSSSDTEGPENDHTKQDDKDKTDDDQSDKDLDTSHINDSITDQDTTVNNDSLWEHSLGVKKEISSSQYNTANDSTVASKDTSFESFNNSSLTINDDLNDSFEDQKNDSFNASKEVEEIGAIEDSIGSDQEQKNESLSISNSDVEIVGAVEDTSILNESTSSNQEEVASTVLEDDQHVEPELTPKKLNLIQEVGTGLIAHPMRMEEEVFDGYGEAEEEIESQDDSEDTTNKEETRIDISNNAQEQVDTKEIKTNDENEEVTVAQTIESLNSFADNTPVKPVEISIAETNKEDISITIEDYELVNTTKDETKIDIDEHEASKNTEKLLEAQSSSSEASAMSNFDENLPGTVEILVSKLTGAKVYLIGTAHFSQESCEDVAKVINSVKPHVVMLELCQQRTNILHLDEQTIIQESQNLTMQRSLEIIREQGGLQGVMYLLLLSMSAHITKELGMAPGGEFRRAFQEALKIPGCVIHLGDRPIGITMKRALGALNLWQKIKLGFNVLTSNDTITKEEVEKCKEKDLLENLLAEMAGEFPALSRVFVDERDVYLAHSLQVAADLIQVDPNARGGIVGPSPTILPSPHPRIVVGVVGIGHMKGIINHFGTVTPEQVKQYAIVHPPSRIQRITTFALKMAVLGGIGFCTYKAVKIPTKFIFNRFIK